MYERVVKLDGDVVDYIQGYVHYWNKEGGGIYGKGRVTFDSILNLLVETGIRIMKEEEEEVALSAREAIREKVFTEELKAEMKKMLSEYEREVRKQVENERRAVIKPW